MPTPSFTLTIGGQHYQVSGLSCQVLQGDFAERGLAHAGWSLLSCGASPVNTNTKLVFAKSGQANRTVQVSAVSPLIPTSLPKLTVDTNSTVTTAHLIELQSIKAQLQPWLTPDFFNWIAAFFLLVLFWIGFNAGAKTSRNF